MWIAQIIVVFVLLFSLERVYLALADKYNIIDKPNERSSHTRPTIRGGGIIFPLAWICYFFFNGFAFPYFTLGLALISIISFMDDLGPLSAKLRLLVHLVAFTLCFVELNIFHILPAWAAVLTYIIAIGSLNAINFMDGINGITGLYSLAIFFPLLPFWEEGSIDLAITSPIGFIVISLLVFGFYNFRKKARCFAGDVGSVSIGFLMLFFSIALILNVWHIESGSWSPSAAGNPDMVTRFKYILFFAVYGVDAVLTIIHRLLLKENIFQAHRKHLYQYLSNELKWPHMLVAFIYAGIQLTVNLWVIHYEVSLLQAFLLLFSLAIIYIVAKVIILRRKVAGPVAG